VAAGHSPLEQFAIKRFIELDIGGVDFSFTNASAMMVLAVVCIISFVFFGTRSHALVPNRWQSMVELSYELIAKSVRDNIGPEGRPFFPLIFSLFMFILFCNVLGLIPYSFTVTSHIIVTFAFAGAIFVGVTLLGFVRHGLKFFSLFLPPGVPLFLAPLLVPIEFVSYLSRPISLSVRLAANMMAGHTMLKVFAGFVVALGFLGVAPLIFIIFLYALETLIAFLQAYVFAVLTCLYLNDAIHLHH
jgi:F-type H+-transporting ATPase subunit a